jgi:hypothetical protein
MHQSLLFLPFSIGNKSCRNLIGEAVQLNQVFFEILIQKVKRGYWFVLISWSILFQLSYDFKINYASQQSIVLRLMMKKIFRAANIHYLVAKIYARMVNITGDNQQFQTRRVCMSIERSEHRKVRPRRGRK